MTELSASDFMPQWQYDHSQDREYIEDEAAIQWRGTNRVAEQVRRREEHDLEVNFDAMDFEARAAALEAHFFGVKRRSPPPERDVPRVRPQSASLARRIANSDSSSASNFDVPRRQRPQSAKNRLDIPKTSEGVDWSTSIESKASKWREMLVRGPEFKQLTLRQLEVETYELLHSTLEHTNVQLSARRRKRKKKASDVAKSNSKELACGSDLHLARSRKKRQQEHDRELMLGKTGQPSRRSKREQATTKVGGKQSIQDKTRRRGKQLQTKSSRTQLQERQPVQVLTRDKRTDEMYAQRPSSANRVRGPWVPSGSARSAAIRGISPATEVTQDKRIEQMLEEVFQRQIHAHMSKSKIVQNQLKKAQQRVKSCRSGESRTSKIMNKSGRPASAPRIATSSTDEVGVSLQNSKGNQENDRIRGTSFRQSTLFAPALADLQLSSREIEALISESPVTPKLMIPPLRFPPNLWKYQLTDDSQDGISELPQKNSFHLPSNSLGAGDDDTSQLKSTCDDKIEGESAPSCDMTNMEHVDEIGTQVEVPAHDHDRRATVEDLYLAEGLDEQTSSGFSSGGNETLPSELEPESHTLREVLAEDDKCTNIELLDPDMSTPKGVESAQISTSLGEERIHTEILTTSARATDSPLQVAADTAKDSSVENEISAETLYLLSRAQDSVVTLVESTNIEVMTVDHNVYEDHCSKKESMTDREGDGIDVDVVMGEEFLQQNEFEDIPLIGQCNGAEDEQHEDACQELKTTCDVTTFDPIVTECCSVIPIPPELVLNHNSPGNPESITSAVKSDTPLEIQAPIRHDGDLEVGQTDFTTIEDSGLPLTFTIETVALNLSSQSSESSEVVETGQVEALKIIDCEDSIAGTSHLGNTDQYQTSASNDEQQPEEPEDVESLQLKYSEHVNTDNDVPAAQSIFERTPILPETSILTPVTHEDKVEEDPIRLHQQEVTRSFLKRISSRTCTAIDQELLTGQPEPRKEQVEDDDTLGSTERTNGVELQTDQNVKVVKEQEHIHGCVIECQIAQALEDDESTSEKYPPATESLATTSPTEKVDIAESFTRADGDSTVTDIEDIATKIETPWQQEPDPNNSTDCDMDTLSHLVSSEVDVVDRTVLSVEFHNAARIIQAQYRCFVRRRLILDQLHFVVANQRRQARKKSRQKEHKTKSVDMVTSIHVPEANSMDSLLEEVQPVVLTTRSDKGVEVTPELPLKEEPRPSVEDAERKSRKGSYEYSFDLFDGLSEASDEGKLDMSVRTPEDSNGTRPEKLEQQQENPTILSDQDVGTSVELLQGEKTNVLRVHVVPSDTIEVNLNLEELTASASTTSTMQAELAVIDNVEENPVPKSVKSHVETAEVDSRWERYVDSTTSKSYYFNPNTNETQWTTPGDDRSHSIIISSRVTSTTPHSAAGTAPYAAVSLTRQSEVWQEFLDEASGQLYYYNTKTGECSWEQPASDSPGVVESLQSSATAESEAIGANSWIMYIDPASQAPYYVNVETLATSWEKPDDFVVTELTANGETYVIAVDDHASLEI